MNTDKKIIFLPDTESAAKLIEQSWQAFKKEAEENGLAISGADTEAFIKDLFVAGYAYGHNDCLNIIRGQMEVEEILSNSFGNPIEEN